MRSTRAVHQAGRIDGAGPAGRRATTQFGTPFGSGEAAEVLVTIPLVLLFQRRIVA